MYPLVKPVTVIEVLAEAVCTNSVSMPLQVTEPGPVGVQ